MNLKALSDIKVTMYYNFFVDIGSSYLAILDWDGNEFFYSPHKGEFKKILTNFNINLSNSIFTGKHSLIYKGIHPFYVLINLAQKYKNVSHILYVGASSFFLINLDEKGNYVRHVLNTTCASGTGSFLDLQAKRLGFSIEEFGQRALKAKVKPSVSTRCSVFAKTDLIHLQQEGYTKEEIAAGLCESLAENIIDTLFKGSQPDGKILLCGGVFQNQALLNSFKLRFGEENLICEKPYLSLTLGLKELSRKKSFKLDESIDYDNIFHDDNQKTHHFLKIKEDYPDFDKYQTIFDELGNEITFYKKLDSCTLPVYLGIDIGSTSTKICIIDKEKEPVIGIYRKTSSDPINAVKFIFNALLRIEKEKDISFNFLGVATTGSGRKMIKQVINADEEINEITAHALAAAHIDKDVDTIIEIGGQDSKFTKMKDGMVYYSVMNYVCAAGTGSFIEEQAEKLGIPIKDFAKYAENRTPPLTSDRCTVFMEKDIDLLIAKGVPKEDIAAAVLFAVRDNYLNKVVGNVPIGEKVYFQGATARNRALVSAFEERLNKKIIVSPYCHLTGALGAALYVSQKQIDKSKFVGLDFSKKETIIEKENCNLCVNKCSLSIIKTDNVTVAWGLKCGRDYESKKPKNTAWNPYLKQREAFLSNKKTSYKNGKIIIPDFLGNAENIYFLKSFLEALDIEPVIYSPSKDDYERGRKIAHFEICAPCVITFGAISKIKDEKVFFPHFLKNKVPAGITECHLCPLTQSIPAILKTQKKDLKIISPKILKINNDNISLNSLRNELSNYFKVSIDEIKKSLDYAENVCKKELERKYIEGDKFLENLKDDEIGIIFLGRPYILYNPRLNHRLIDKIGEYNIKAITIDFIRPDIEFIKEKFPHIYWQYGQIILSSLKLFKQKRNLFPIFLSCFSCGPDSFILNYFYREMESLKKPYLVLQLDGHSSATGYITRLEAGIDSFYNYLKLNVSGDFTKDKYSKVEDIPEKNRTVLIPPMDEKGAELIASAFKTQYKSAETLKESLTTFREGLKYSTGYECSPFHSTLGAVLNRTKNGEGKYAYFMPTGIGPCRFGQYSLFQNIILKSLGKDVQLISPSDRNAYAGISNDLKKIIFDGILINDILKKIALSTRPYEVNKGETDEKINIAYENIRKAIEARTDYIDVFRRNLLLLSSIKTQKVRKPVIGIVGEIYVRSNSFLNDNLIRTIEALGGEARIATISEWFFYTLFLQDLEIRFKNLSIKDKFLHCFRKYFYFSREHKILNYAKEFFPNLYEPSIYEVVEKGSKYLPEEFLGEAILTVGRALIFFEKENVDAVVNASPTFCMPGTISSYILKDMERQYKKPVISLFYDKTGKPNFDLIPYLEILKNKISQDS